MLPRLNRPKADGRERQLMARLESAPPHVLCRQAQWTRERGSRAIRLFDNSLQLTTFGGRPEMARQRDRKLKRAWAGHHQAARQPSLPNFRFWPRAAPKQSGQS